jgi:hypothetical protein
MVTVIPVVVVWVLLDRGVISSPWVCVGLAVALSLGASLLGSAYWKRRGGHGDVFFSELLLWGWLHRMRGERRLNSAVGRLGLNDPEQHLAEGETSVERKAQLLREMAAALDAQDPYTDGHSRRVALHSAMVARRMHLPREDVDKIRMAAAVHDIGKLRIPAEVLNKPEPLTPEEFEIVKRHADEGADIVSSMEDPAITAMVRHHHERFDGGGYPAGLVGEHTPLGARIIAVADTFDALTSLRPYRAAIPHKQALDAVAAASATQLDPVVVRTFLKCYSAKRATVFWTLLAVSPTRAFASVRGRGPAPGGLASAGTVATPAIVAAVFGLTLGSSASILSRDPLGLAQPTLPSRGTSAQPRTTHAHPHRARPAIAAIALAAPLRRHAVVAATTTRHGPTAISHARRGGGSITPSPHPSPPPKKPGAPPGSPPTHHPKPVSPKPPPAQGSGTGGSGSGPSTPPVNAGGGGSSGGTPLTKQACKNGGYAGDGFSNQGQCVASVEHGAH